MGDPGREERRRCLRIGDRRFEGGGRRPAIDARDQRCDQRNKKETAGEPALDTVALGQRRLEPVQQLGDQAAPGKVLAYIRARTAHQLE